MPGTTAANVPASDAYLTLIRRFPLRPIRSDAVLDEAITLVAELGGRGELGQLSGDESDYLKVLITLVEQYEDVTEPID